MSFCKLAPLALIVGGLTVMAGWWLQIGLIVQPLPGEVAMQFNTALCFALLGAAAFMTQHRIAHDHTPAIICGLIAFATLVEYQFDLNLGLDDLLFDPFVTDHTSHPGRMAPSTSTAFCLAAVAVHDLRTSIKQSLYVMVGTLGTLAVVGYLIGVSALYDWGGELTNMAVHTGLGFMVVGGLGVRCDGRGSGV